MAYTSKKLPKNVLEFSFEIPAEEIKNDLNNAARAISQNTKIDGFRPGKASYNAVKGRVGEMAIYEKALSGIVRRNFVAAVRKEKIRTYGEPKINVTQLAPGNTITFTAEVALVPNITSMEDFRKIKIKRKQIKIDDKKVDEAIDVISKMQTKEIRVTREVKEGDKIVVDMNLSLAGVPIEGGQAKDHGIYLNEENYYVPGIKEQVLGMKEGKTKEFKLRFPKDHFQKNIAGNEVEFKVTMKEIYELEHPTIDDEFAKSVGQDSLQQLRDVMKENIRKEEEKKEMQRAELEMLETLEKKSRFEDIPELILNTEVNRMLEELQNDLEHRGMKFEDYLMSIKKTEGELKLEFTTQAIKRVKSALIIREISEQEDIEIDDSEILEEQQKLINQYSDNAEAQKKIRSEDYIDYIRTNLKNRKVMDLLKETIK